MTEGIGGGREACGQCQVLLRLNEQLQRQLDHAQRRSKQLGRRNQTLRTRLRHAEALNRKLLTQVQQLQDQVRELSGKARATACNSSLPPSANPPGARPPVRKRPSGRRIGAQVGHVGHGRKLLPPSQVDRVVRYQPRQCEHCRAMLPQEQGPVQVVARHQQWELPERPALLTEYQACACRCSVCGKESRGQIPPEIACSVTGPRLSALIGYLPAATHVSRRTVATVMSGVLGVPLSLGTVSQRERELGKALAGPYEQLRATVAGAKVKYVDETGWKRAARWLWVAATPSAVVFATSRARTYPTLLELLGEDHAQMICTDRHGIYDKYPLHLRGICWAHLKRDFQRCVDRGGISQTIGAEALEVCRGVFGGYRHFRKGRMSRKALKQWMRPLQLRMRRILERGQQCGVKKTAGLCRRLLKLWGPMWRFVTVKGLEPTNNLAERMLRGAVIWRKISFGSHSTEGCRFVERMLSVTATLKLHQRSILDYLARVIEARRKGLDPPAILDQISEATPAADPTATKTVRQAA
jgi:transposase